MNGSPLPGVLLFLGQGMLLFLGLFAIARSLVRTPVVPWVKWLLLLICGVILWIPVQGLPVHRWVAGVIPGFSLPLLAVLSHATIRIRNGHGFLRTPDLESLWIFGALSGLLLYPLAMGVGARDPYASGWGLSWLFFVLGALAALLLIRRNRLGGILFAAILAWHLRGLESDNYWDYLVDPLFFLTSLGMVLWTLMSRRRPAARTTG